MLSTDEMYAKAYLLQCKSQVTGTLQQGYCIVGLAQVDKIGMLLEADFKLYVPVCWCLLDLEDILIQSRAVTMCDGDEDDSCKRSVPFVADSKVEIIFLYS